MVRAVTIHPPHRSHALRGNADSNAPALRDAEHHKWHSHAERGNDGKHTLTWLDNGEVKIDYRPVHMYTLSDDVEVIPPKERVY